MIIKETVCHDEEENGPYPHRIGNHRQRKIYIFPQSIINCQLVLTFNVIIYNRIPITSSS